MEYAKEDICRYMDTFPGECTLYRFKEEKWSIVYFSEHVPGLLGRTREEYLAVIEQDVLAWVLENDKERLRRELKRMEEDSEPSNLYIRAMHKEKGYVWLHIRAKFIRKDGEEKLILAEYQDTEFETDGLMQLLAFGDRHVYICDADNFELLYMNEKVLSYLGKSDYQGRTCHEFLKGCGRPCEDCVYFAMQGNRVHVKEQYMEHLHGWYRSECQKIRIYGKDAFIFYIKDITEEVERKQQLMEDNVLIEQITSTVFDFIGVTDVNRRTIRFRESGRKSDEITQIRTNDYDVQCHSEIETLVIPEERKYCHECSRIENVVKQLEQMKVYSYAWTQEEDDGRETRKLIKFCWLDETHEKFIVMKSDITKTYLEQQKRMKQLRQATEAAEKANNAKSNFLSRISHDMRTPLNGIIGLTRLMQKETDLENIRKNLIQLNLSGEYLMHLINDTLDVGRIESGKLELHPVVCEGRSVFANTLALIRPNLEEKHIRLNVHADGLKFTTLYLDVGRMEQLIMNVLGNAIKFTPEGGTIDFSVENLSYENGVLYDKVTVRDTGVGISPDFLPHVFEPFSQEYNTSTSQYQGTGLGMTIVKSIVELMGGEISVKSEPGQGTEVCFTLKLPVATEEQIAQTRKKAASARIENSLAGKQILLCEDNPLNAEIVMLLLKEVGCVTVHAQNGKQGVELFAANPALYDAILMDVRMPVMDGLEAAKTIRAMDTERARKVPIIALTANAYEEDIRNCLEAGMNAHMAKPLEPDRMYRLLAENIMLQETT